MKVLHWFGAKDRRFAEGRVGTPETWRGNVIVHPVRQVLQGQRYAGGAVILQAGDGDELC